ncbi:serine/threonine-protein kinase [Melittangium boletus]|uniref:non-specific serine/threonine protein kinase n=1 Tax=Melittangium boletus DSM 14713 TaxID=1294270 RepID=A0A250ITK1_9BACT|nr:serine/threonine-protein kinase [Melittangium boletus]ATB34593.1 protein kinase [Melittangium boletus DSM 14713]
MKKPTLFGKYLLLERINVGGMAEVFTAKAFGVEGFERILAIKKILPTMAEDDEFITMFIDEARISVQLNHANIVHIHELGKHEDTYFIAMEYVPGRDLRTLLERYRRRKEIMPTAQAVFLASKICEGLDYAHRKKDARGQDLNIIHRDISPQNILISYEGEVKIIDFGIAKAANRSQKTQAGILKGKFGYMSPEQVRGLPIDRRSDIFAVGVILYEMLTGERLFVGESDFSTLEKVRNADVPTPRQFNPNIPAGLERVLMKALSGDADTRYQWGSDLQEDLMRFLLAGDAIYSSKHLSAYMKDAFAEDILREAEKMERYASIERPELIETSGVTGDMMRAPRRNQSMVAMPVASRSPTPVAQNAPRAPYVPPPTQEELAELDGAGEKTQIVDSTYGSRPDAPPEPSSSVLVDDSLTGETDYAAAASAAQSPRGRGGVKSRVVIGEESESYAGATVVGPAPSAPAEFDASVESNATRVGHAASNSTMIGPALDDEPDAEPPSHDEQDDQRAYADEPEDGYDEPQGLEHEEDPQEEEATGPILLNQEPEPSPAKPTPSRGKPARAEAPTRKKLPPKALIGIAAGCAVLVVALVGFMLSGPSTGRVMISVQPSRGADVRIDGKLMAQNEVIQLDEGAHSLSVKAPGYLASEKEIRVTKGQQPQVIQVVLTEEPPTGSATGSAVADAQGSPSGTNTQPTATPTPSGEGKDPTQAQVPPSEPTAAATGTEPRTGTASPPPEEAPKPTLFSAEFVGTPAGTEVAVGGQSAGKTPEARLANLTIGKTYEFKATRAGYKSFSGKFRSDGEEQVKVSFELEKEAPPPAPVIERPVAPKPPPARVVAKVVAKGKLACSSRPNGAEIWVDGKFSGRKTPAALGNALELPAGTHTVVFKLDGKQSKPQTVKITEGELEKLINVQIE